MVAAEAQERDFYRAGRRAFLGGRYATPATLPPGARPLGRSTRGETVLTVPARPDLLYTREAGTVERWLPLPRLADGGGVPDAFFMGDSVMLDARPALARALHGWNTRFDAAVSRTSFVGIGIAASLRGQPLDAEGLDDGGAEHASPDVRNISKFEQSLNGSVLTKGAVQNGKNDVHVDGTV